MSILNVDKIQPIGSGSTVTVNATDTILTNAQAGVITATSFSGSGANLTSLPAANLTGTLPAISGANLTSLPTQVTINSNSANRIITGEGGTTLTAEANLIFNGSELYPDGASNADRDKVGHRLNYRRNAPNSRTNTGSASTRYYKIGEIVLNGSESAEINMYGTVGYSAGQEVAGKTTIIIRATNASTLVGFWYEESLGQTNLSDVRWKYTGSNNVYELWVQANNYSNIAPFVRCTGNGYTSFNTDTGSNTAPSGSTALSTYNRKVVGTTATIRYNPTDTTFHQNIKMDNGKGIDFSATADGGANANRSELLNDYEEGNFSVSFWASSGNFSTAPTLTSNNGRYVKVGNQVTFSIYVAWSNNGAGGSGNIYCSGLPFTNNGGAVYSGVYYGWWDLHSAALNSDETFTGYINNGQSYVVMGKSHIDANAGFQAMNVNDFMNGKSGSMQMNGHYYVS